MATITFRRSGEARTVAGGPAVSVLNSLLREGVRIPHVCGGKALCGTCRVRVLSGSVTNPISGAERERLDAVGAGPEERLACRLYTTGDLEIETDAAD